MKRGKEKVVVAMSGGVDSSVAAALLVEKGYDVTGMMLRLWSEPGMETHNRCCTPSAMGMAKQIAGQLDIPFYAIDAKDIFHEKVVSYFIDEYQKGTTPNPCYICNRNIRFEFLLNRALSLGARFLATGHYAQVIHSPNQLSILRKGLDPDKDQSYVLSVLNQKQLKHALFPIGGYTKSKVREIAAKLNLPSAKEKDSQDLCFLAGTDYSSFLRRNQVAIDFPGDFIDHEGKVVGRHQGLAFYTVGQRKRLGISTPVPLYVLEKNIAENTIRIGPKEMLGLNTLISSNVNWISTIPEETSFEGFVKIRYKAPSRPATIEKIEDNKIKISFDEEIRDITPGQAVVVYQGDQVICSGIIEDKFAKSPKFQPIKLIS